MKIYSFLKAVALMAALPAFATTANAVTWSVNPTPGFISTPITEVTLTIEDATDLSFSSRALNYYDPAETVDKTGIIYFGGDKIDQQPNSYEATISGNTVTFKVKNHNGVWDINGKYSLSIPAGAIKYKLNGLNTSCPMISVNWYLSDLANISLTPAPGNVSDLSTITLSLPEGYSFSANYFTKNFLPKFAPRIYLADLDNQPTGSALAYYTLPEDVSNTSLNGKREITMVNPLDTRSRQPWKPENGKKYVIQIVKSSLTIRNEATGNKESCLAANYLYTFNDHTAPAPTDIFSCYLPASTNVNITADSEDNEYGMGVVVWSLKTDGIHINRECKESVKLFYNDTLIRELNAANEQEINIYIVAPSDLSDEPTLGGIESIVFIFMKEGESLDAYTKTGTYRVEVPTGLLTAPGGDIEGTSVSYNVVNNISTGVEAIDGETLYTVYNVSGVKVLSNATAAEVKGLPKGFYIINGKKALLK